MRKDFAETFKDVKSDFEKLKLDVEAFIDKYVKACAEPILACKNEAEFIKALAEVGDTLYDGNKIAKQNKNIFKKFLFAFSEKYDKFIFNSIIKFIDKKFLDKHLGENWFLKLQNRAREFRNTIDTLRDSIELLPKDREFE